MKSPLPEEPQLTYFLGLPWITTRPSLAQAVPEGHLVMSEAIVSRYHGERMFRSARREQSDMVIGGDSTLMT
ncbi:hypothetical protein EG832_00485 [bacterium]|nr:hypothetical protein [bacterium]